MPDDPRIPNFTRGKKMIAADMAALAQSSDANRVRFGNGVVGMRTPGGVSLRMMAGSTVAAQKPFALMRYSDAGLKLKLRPGTVNGMLPDNIFTGISYTGTGTEYVKLSCATSAYALTTITVTCDSTAPTAIVPTANAAPTSFDILMHVLVGGLPLSCLYTTNIIARPLLTYFLERTSPAAGAALYDLYYSWEVAAATVPA